MELIDWNSVGIALEQQHPNTKVQLVKSMHNWLNIGHQKKQFNKDRGGTHKNFTVFSKHAFL
eukprot:15216446-Ditylum_brightwellii.AAC.1